MTERHHYKYVVLDSSKENGNAVQAKFNVQIPVTKSTEVGLRGDLPKINKISKNLAKLRPPYPRRTRVGRKVRTLRVRFCAGEFS